MLTKNPDPEATNMFKDLYAGITEIATGNFRPRYTVLKEIDAPHNVQTEMRILTTTLFFLGVGVGVGLTCGICILVGVI
jgi:hypothetical protein